MLVLRLRVHENVYFDKKAYMFRNINKKLYAKSKSHFVLQNVLAKNSKYDTDGNGSVWKARGLPFQRCMVCYGCNTWIRQHMGVKLALLILTCELKHKIACK